jgi:WD40 repeat protein
MGLWDWLGKKQRQLSVGSTYPGAAAFSPDGATVVATSPTGEVKFWKVATGEEVGTFRIEGVRNVAIFADGHAMVTASMDGTLRVWRVSPPERAP